MKRFTNITALLTACTLLLSGCGTADKTADYSSKPHLYDYEQTLLQLGIDAPEHSEDNILYTPLNFSPQYAMWFTVNDYPDILLNKTEEEFTACVKERFSNAKKLGINTVYVHARAFGDAYYKSELFSKGLFMSSDADYDPLEIMVKTAHETELSIHAWINPMRCQSEVQMQDMSDEFTLKKWFSDKDKNGKYIVRVEDRYWLCPAYSEVRKFIAEGAAEIVHNYEVDGIHIDDYFYPTSSTDFDAEAFSESNTGSLSAFRKEQCSLLVKEIYDAVKSENENVLFGISPQGTLNGNNTQYADPQKWCSEEGYCDYIVPQIYFGLKNETAPFMETVSLWKDLVTNEKIDLIIGICTYKMGREDIYAGSGSMEWIEDHGVSSKELEIVRDMNLGAALYSYNSTFCPADDIEDDMEKERSAIQTLLSE
ncbi:MAG: glycoside hydrolase family 10 protein [Ruminococcus sp.]